MINDSVMRENTKCDGHSHFDKWLALSLGDICLLPRSSISLLKEGEISRQRTARWREVQIEEPYPNICHLWQIFFFFLKPSFDLNIFFYFRKWPTDNTLHISDLLVIFWVDHQYYHSKVRETGKDTWHSV